VDHPSGMWLTTWLLGGPPNGQVVDHMALGWSTDRAGGLAHADAMHFPATKRATTQRCGAFPMKAGVRAHGDWVEHRSSKW
jgi:hypothetical protein